MGKQYYCDFCDKAFADNAASKKNHFNGAHHQRMRRAHYDAFRGTAVKTKIGKGLHIPHPIGIVINGKAKIGDYCTIMQQVTIGNKLEDEKVPEIGNNVFIGAGAKIIGDIKIEDNVIIGANSVVTKNVSKNCIVAGVPAKLIGKRNDTLN